MTYITIKVDSNLFCDMRYCKLPEDAKATFWGILALAGTDGIEVDRFRWLSHAGSTPILNALRKAGFIGLEKRTDGSIWIVPTGRGAKRHVETARIRDWRNRKKAEIDASACLETARPIVSSQAQQPPLVTSKQVDTPLDAVAQPTTNASNSPGNVRVQAAAIALEPSPFDNEHWDAPIHLQIVPAGTGNTTRQARASGRTFHDEGILEVMVADGVQQQTAKDFLQIRERKGKPLLAAGWQAEKARVAEVGGCTLQEAINFACTKTWASLVHNGFVSPPGREWPSTPGPATHTKDALGRWKKRTGGVVL
ncbi:MAG: hypothetical protein ACO1PB_04725 [Ramlibacter sp.]